MILRFIDGKRAGQNVNLPDAGLLIGRDADCALRLDGEKISRHHAMLRYEGYGYVIEDRQSTNGVFVNGEKVPGRRTLMNGDRVRIGDHLMLFTDERDVLPEEELQRRSAATARDAEVAAGRRRTALAVLTVAIGVAAVGLLVWQMLRPPPPPPVVGPTPGGGGAVGAVGTADPLAVEPFQPVRPGATGTSDGPGIGDSVLPAAPVAPAVSDAATLPGTAATPPAATPGAAPAAPPGPSAPVDVRDVWIQSDPPGAVAWLDDRELGRTPILARRLSDGEHTLRLELDGHQTLTRTLFIPYLGEYPMYTLEIAPRVALVTSEPPNVSVFMGTQLLGRTPFYLMGWPVGTYDLRLAATGLQTTTVRVEIQSSRGTRLHEIVPLAVGSLEVVTLPPGAEVLVDGVVMGTTVAADDPHAASRPFVVPRLYPGGRVVTIRYAGLSSAEYKATLQPDATVRVEPVVWLPNIRLTLDDGKVVSGMLRAREADGSVVVALSPTRSTTIPAAKIVGETVRTYDASFNAGGEWPAP